MEMAYTFFYELWDGSTGYETHVLNQYELGKMCDEYSKNHQIKWWDYDECEEVE